MEMRKFVVELHTDGRMTWAEYPEPRDARELLRLVRDCVIDRRMEVEARALECAHRDDSDGVELMRVCATEDRLIEILIDRVCKDYGV